MGNIKSRDYSNARSTSNTSYANDCPPLGYPTTDHQARKEDPFLSLLKGFSQIYLQGKEVIERRFPGACDGLLDYLNKISLQELVPRYENRACMQRSLSMSSVHDNERFKVRDLVIDGVAGPDGDRKPPVQGDHGQGHPK